MAKKASSSVKVYSFSLPPKVHDDLVEAARLMEVTKSSLVADTLQSAMPSLLEMARAMAAVRAGKLSPNALLATMTRAMAAPVLEAQMTLADALETGGGAHGTRSGPGVSPGSNQASGELYLRNRNKSGQTAKTVQKISKGKVSARGKAKP